jgi:serine/threonine protein kinase
VALGVHHAHEHGIIHRDLKPGNVLVTHGARPVVTDFGLATMERRSGETGLTPSGFIVGSPGYMSPEQARGQRQLDRTTDVYSLGIILYEFLAGRVPFEGRTPVEILSRVLEGIRTPPSACGPDARKDEMLDRVCLKAVSLNPADRYPTALAFADQLTDWLGETKEGMRISPFRIAITVTATALLCAAVFLFWQRQSTAASVRRHLERAEQSMKESNFTAALGSYELALAEDRQNEAALSGRDQARRLLETRRPPPAPVLNPEVVLDLQSFHQDGNDPYNKVTPTMIEFQRNSMFSGDVPVTQDGEYVLTIIASCSAAKGEFAHVRVRVDGRVLAEIALRAEARDSYGLITRLASGTRNLGLEFTNDYFNKKTGEDRNLYVHRVSLRRVN